MVQKISTLIAQIVACLMILSFTFIALPVGNGWEVVALTIFYTIGVCLVGWGIAKLFKSGFDFTLQKGLIVLVCGALGAAILLIPGVLGLGVYLLPAAGAIIGYHIVMWF